MTPFSVDRSFDWLCGLALPPRCILCGRSGQRPCLDLCRNCESSLPWRPRPLQLAELPLSRHFAPFAYEFPMDQVVRSLKYRSQLATARVLGCLLADAIRSFGLHLDVDGLVPVPLHPLRHAERGYNQAAEIARWAGRAVGVPVWTAMARRTRDTRPQVGLKPDERRANISSAFTADPRMRGRRVVVVDDVLTTGSTVAALAAALRDAGSASVDAWCVARADAPDKLHWPPTTGEAAT